MRCLVSGEAPRFKKAAKCRLPKHRRPLAKKRAKLGRMRVKPEKPGSEVITEPDQMILMEEMLFEEEEVYGAQEEAESMTVVQMRADRGPAVMSRAPIHR